MGAYSPSPVPMGDGGDPGALMPPPGWTGGGDMDGDFRRRLPDTPGGTTTGTGTDTGGMTVLEYSEGLTQPEEFALPTLRSIFRVRRKCQAIVSLQ